MGKSTGLKILGVALDILQMVFALLVVVLTSWKLLNVSAEGINLTSSCALDGSDSDDAISGTRFCAYAISVGVISFIASLIFTCIKNIFKCVTLNVCKASRVIAVIGDTALGIWWVVAFIFFVQRGTAANRLGWPERPARDGVIASAFGAMAAFFSDVIVTLCSAAQS